MSLSNRRAASRIAGAITRNDAAAKATPRAWRARRSAHRSPCAAPRRRPRASRLRRSLARALVSTAIGAGLHHGEPVGRNAVIGGEQARGRRAGRNHLARASERRALARAQGGRLIRAQSRFERQRMMHQRDQRMARLQRLAPHRGARRRPARRSRPADPAAARPSWREAAARICARRPREAVAEIEHAHSPAERRQARR